MTEDRRCSEMAAENKRFSWGFLFAMLLSYFGLSILLFPDFISSFIVAVWPADMVSAVLVCVGVMVLAVSSVIMGSCYHAKKADKKSSSKQDSIYRHLWY